MADSVSDIDQNKSETKKKRFPKRHPISSSDYIVRRRVPPRPTKRKNDINVTSNANFRGQLSQCMKLIDDGETEIIIHGLGAAIPQAVNLALQLEERLMGLFIVSPATETVDVIDDLEPVVDDLEGDTRTRSNSSIHIKLYKRETALAT